MQDHERRSHASPPLPNMLPDRLILSRRGALRGSLAASLGLMAGVAPVLAAPALSANDARLVALADAYAALEATVEVTPSTDPGYDALLRRYRPLEDALVTTLADTMAGVLAKARVLQVPSLRQCEEIVSLSMADNLHRLFGGGAHA